MYWILSKEITNNFGQIKLLSLLGVCMAKTNGSFSKEFRSLILNMKLP